MNYANDLTGFFVILGFMMLILLTTAILEKRRIPTPRGEDTSHATHVTPMPSSAESHK